MNPTQASWETMLLAYGPLGGIALFVAYMAWTLLPKLAAKHIDFVDATKAQGDRVATAVERIADMVEVQARANRQTNKAIEFLADAVQAGANECGERVSNAVRPHLASVKGVVRGGD